MLKYRMRIATHAHVQNALRHDIFKPMVSLFWIINFQQLKNHCVLVGVL